jgi:sulfopyruvate decarboxylase subunit alpha
LTASEICQILQKHGFNFATGVPCSILKDIILNLSAHPDIPYIPATREDEAMGIAAGAFLAGKKPVVLMQNSGLGSSMSPLSSLHILYKIPALLLISWRGYQGKDAPEHLIMGQLVTKLLEDLGVPVQVMSEEDPEDSIQESSRKMAEKRIPAAIMVKRGIIK